MGEKPFKQEDLALCELVTTVLDALEKIGMTVEKSEE